jgi:mRNA-degrading endonuclease RelE of RelBE toxin-antitoxin system
MTYKVFIAPTAQAEMDAFAVYAAGYSDDFAVEQFGRLNQILTTNLAESPNMWAHFYITGAPYRGYLFRVGRRTQFWIVYAVNDATQTVSVLRFWSPRRYDAEFEI